MLMTNDIRFYASFFFCCCMPIFVVPFSCAPSAFAQGSTSARVIVYRKGREKITLILIPEH